MQRLRAEVARLKQEQEQAPAEPRDRTGWWRPVVAGILVLVAAVLAPLSVLATWANGQIDDTDRYIATVGPLANDPDVQKAVAARVEQVVFSYLDIDAATSALVDAINQQGLPPAAAATLQAAIGPLASGIRNFVSDQILKFVQSDAFEAAWIQANREAHSQLVAALTGKGDAVKIENGEETIGLATIIDAVKTQLTDAGFAIADRIPEVNATFTVFQSSDLGKVQTALGLLDDLSTWLPVIGLGLLAIAVILPRCAAGQLVRGRRGSALRPDRLLHQVRAPRRPGPGRRGGRRRLAERAARHRGRGPHRHRERHRLRTPRRGPGRDGHGPARRLPPAVPRRRPRGHPLGGGALVRVPRPPHR